ncbi:MAG: HAD family hydrolase [Clostridiales bacterium]|nr:HAD family hydrolase [Clostridiales bacterium]
MKSFNQKIRAIIFDCYGTIIDTGNSSINATKKILAKYNQNTNAEEFYSKWKKYQRKYFENADNFLNQEDIFLITLKELFQEYHIKGDPNIDVQIMLNILGKRYAFPESAKTIDLLRAKYKIYVASISDEEPIISDIKRNKVVVDGIFTSESMMVYKPNKHFFYQVLDKVNLNENEVIYVGDSLYDDIYGPMSIGIKSIWINRKNQTIDTEQYRPNYTIETLDELLEFF